MPQTAFAEEVSSLPTITLEITADGYRFNGNSELMNANNNGYYHMLNKQVCSWERGLLKLGFSISYPCNWKITVAEGADTSKLKLEIPSGNKVTITEGTYNGSVVNDEGTILGGSSAEWCITVAPSATAHSKER